MYSLTKECGELFDQIGVFNGKALVRMMDAKLLTEIAYALLNGITTTNKQVLDSLYKKYDESFPESDDFRAGIVGAMRTIDRWKALHNGPLARSYMMYSLLLAVMHLSQPVPKLMVYYEIQNPIEIDDDQAIIALSSLADAVEREDPPKELSDFVRACASSTNGSNQRVTRFKTFCSAIALRR
jgi:hypothetical protein